MNPDVVSAIARLRSAGVLADGQAAFFDRVARRRLVSIRFEIRALLYAGVLLLTSGVGVLLAEHHREIGPLAIAGGIALAAAACFAWVIRKAVPFSWRAVESPNVAFDYVLLLGLLLLAADLAYVEVQFTVLGPRWAYHLLVVALVYLAAAYRWDSRTVLGLALTTLAAWRGISISLVHGASSVDDPPLRANAIALGALYVGAAALSVRLGLKAHLEEVYANAGLLLLLGALVSGALDDWMAWPAWLLLLLVVAGLVMWLSPRLGRSLHFAEAVVAAYIGLVRLLFEPFSDGSSGRAVSFLLAAVLGAGVLVLISAAHRRMRER
ncbi:MAG TPA: DUF2157 domain-containing protein [Methylomirabilota bacterium]|jgi:hypothetical protein